MSKAVVFNINDETSKEEIKQQLNGHGDNGVYFVYDGEKKLHELIAWYNLNLLNLRICKEKSFPYSVSIGSKSKDIKTLSELIKNIEPEDDEVVLDTDDKKEIADLTQQLIYLGLRLNIFLKNEKQNRIRYDKLSEISDTLYDRTKELQAHLKSINLVEQDLKDFVAQLSGGMEKIGIALEDMKRRELILSVMGTKKCGKSMVINSFLGEEYAPTSLELPTPNTIVYQRTEDNKIKLEYEGKIEEFDNSSKINERLTDLFTKANQAESAADKALSDMTIHYSQQSLIDTHLKIADTPGPNLAGANHNKIANEWIEKSDVILYVIDYEKHATNDEISFLEQIKKQFEELDKFYSLIILINKIDKVFETKEDKSLTRITSFIREKIELLGFKNFIAIPTVAKAYFYSDIVKSEVPEPTHEAFKASRKNAQGDSNKREMIRFIDTLIEDLADNDIDRTYDAIVRFSNFDFVKNYSFYIAKGKALDELMQSSIVKIENEMRSIANNYASIDLIKNMGNEKQKIQKIIEELNTGINKMLDAFEMEPIFDEIENKIVRNYSVDITLNTAVKDFLSEVKKKLDDISNSKDKLEQIKKYVDEEIKLEFQRYYDKAFKTAGLEYIGNNIKQFLHESIMDALKTNEKKINEIRKDINQLIKDANIELRKTYSDFLKFETTDIEFAFAKNESIAIDASILYDLKTYTPRLNIKEDKWYKKIMKYFSGRSAFSLENKNEIISEMRDSIEPIIKAATKQMNGDIKNKVKDRLNEIKKETQKQFNEYADNLSPVKHAISDLNKDLSLIEAKMKIVSEFIEQEAYKDIKEKFDTIKKADSGDTL